ncbi:MAG: glycoside hydrolase family 5 protein [Verrucomicrobiaceae bacterium]|nr:glycoside hydrolase family 5 protein [Verrucomicrobiaceae bacterium]
MRKWNIARRHLHASYSPFCVLMSLLLAARGLTADLQPQVLEPVGISADGASFVLKRSGDRFVPWGFNYLGESDTVFEEYWAEKWPAIEEDFREMKKLGANVVRVHLQLGTYMAAADRTRPEELARLRKLLDLAQATGLYLDVTGLGCYHLAKVPVWLDALDEQQRWEVQARFWRAVARTCKGHPAVFCYDLMNEPVVTEAKPGEPPWLTGELGGLYFVQRISNKPGGRAQRDIAAAWVARMTKAIREVDPEHLITVGVIPWAMVWPNAKPVFYAPAAAGHLDFVSVHFYPQAGKVKEALAALKVYDVGKPMVVEEIFPLNCSLAELDEFMRGGGGIVEGWISHYFGRSIADYAGEKDMKSAVMQQFLEYWQNKAPRP